MELTAMHLTHLKAAAEEANFERLYSHEVRQRYGGAAEWDLSTCESDDPEAPDCESIARLYHRDNINYFIEVTPERVLAMVEEIRRLRAALDTKPDAAPVESAREIGTPDLTDDELEIAKAEMDAFYGRTDDDEPDYEAYRAAQEKAHWDMLDQMEDARELDEYFEEHGVEPGGTCPDCGRTDAGCTCKRNAADIMREEKIGNGIAALTLARLEAEEKKVAKLTDAQAKVVGFLISAHYTPGSEINPLDVFPWRDAEGNGLRRTLNKLGKNGILIHAPAYPSYTQIWQMTQEAIDAYRAWYKRRGWKIDAPNAMLD